MQRGATNLNIAGKGNQSGHCTEGQPISTSHGGVTCNRACRTNYESPAVLDQLCGCYSNSSRRAYPKLSGDQCKTQLGKAWCRMIIITKREEPSRRQRQRTHIQVEEGLEASECSTVNEHRIAAAYWAPHCQCPVRSATWYAHTSSSCE